MAKVQTQHAVWSMSQLRFEVRRALPVLGPGVDGEEVVAEVARLAVCGRAGTEVVQVTAPDVTDVADPSAHRQPAGQHITSGPLPGPGMGFVIRLERDIPADMASVTM